jgi:quercetin dioxygenase-like cupin family protein
MCRVCFEVGVPTWRVLTTFLSKHVTSPFISKELFNTTLRVAERVKLPSQPTVSNICMASAESNDTSDSKQYHNNDHKCKSLRSSAVTSAAEQQTAHKDVVTQHTLTSTHTEDEDEDGSLDQIRTFAFEEESGPIRTIRYLELSRTKYFEVGLFRVPKGGHIPLHDHPGMHVIFKVLSGKLHVRSMTKTGVTHCGTPATSNAQTTDPAQQHHLTTLFEQVTCNVHILSSSPDDDHHSTACVLPDSGNIHELYAAEDTIFLDVALPPYNLQAQRDCNYYEFVHMNGSQWVHQIPEPNFWAVQTPETSLSDAVEMRVDHVANPDNKNNNSSSSSSSSSGSTNSTTMSSSRSSVESNSTQDQPMTSCTG